MNDDIWPALVLIVMILTIGGVTLFRPLVKQLGAYLQMLTEQRQKGLPEEDLRRVHDGIEQLHARLQLLEERQDFTDAMLGRHATQEALPGADEERH